MRAPLESRGKTDNQSKAIQIVPEQSRLRNRQYSAQVPPVTCIEQFTFGTKENQESET